MVCLGFKEIWISFNIIVISFNMIIDTYNRCWFWQAAGIVDRMDILLVNVPNQWHAESVTSQDTKLWSARVRQRRTLQPLILILHSSPLSKCITVFLFSLCAPVIIVGPSSSFIVNTASRHLACFTTVYFPLPFLMKACYKILYVGPLSMYVHFYFV